jgi:citrate synthase
MGEATIRHGDKEAAFPVVEAIEGSPGIDIATLRSDLGLITLDRGLGNTGRV